MTTRVLHLAGSPVSDFYADLSRLYASDALAATADPTRYEMVPAYVLPGGQWCFPTDLSHQAIADAPRMSVGAAVQRLTQSGVDAVLPQLFCIPGMTAYRGLLEVIGLPYLGNRPDTMALGAHKARARAVVAAAGVQVPEGESLRAGDHPTLTPPVVVKPVDADNSLGISLVRRDSEYDAALALAFEYSDTVLVEAYVELGREVRAGILERDGELVPLPLEEYNVDAHRKPIRDHGDKIGSADDGDLRLMAKDDEHAWILPTDDPATQPVWAAALACHRAMGARHYSLFDFRIDPNGRPFFLEASLYCSFANSSVLAVMAKAAGIEVSELFAVTLAQTLSS